MEQRYGIKRFALEAIGATAVGLAAFLCGMGLGHNSGVEKGRREVLTELDSERKNVLDSMKDGNTTLEEANRLRLENGSLVYVSGLLEKDKTLARMGLDELEDASRK
ncbi:MAG: hypothetical protein HYS32_04550 [Candidatus Woesearchaeota archaeon]|nr:MAG: hypothetical protein HYS32_04550 [Candidatus Woesearchaeota archaeon]